MDTFHRMPSEHPSFQLNTEKMLLTWMIRFFNASGMDSSSNGLGSPDLDNCNRHKMFSRSVKGLNQMTFDLLSKNHLFIRLINPFLSILCASG